MIQRLTLIVSALLVGHSVVAQDFDQRVTQSVSAAPLAQVLSDLSQKTGIRFLAGNFARDVVSVHVKDVPLNDLMKRLAEATSCAWESDSGAFRLVPDQGLQLRERNAETQARAAAYGDAIVRMFQEYGSGPELTSETARQAVGALQSQARSAFQEVSVGGEGPGVGMATRMTAMGGNTPGGRAIAKLIRGLNPTEFAQIPPGGRLVFTSTPTAAQRPIGAWRPIVAQLMREQNVFTQAAQGAGGDGPMARFIGGVATALQGGEPAAVSLVVSRQGLSDVMLLQLSVTDAQGRPVSIGLQVLNVTPQTPADQRAATGEPLPLSASALEFAKMLGARRTGAEGSRENVVVIAASVDGEADEPIVMTGSPDGPSVAAPVSWRERLLHPERFEPLAFVAGEALVKTALSEGANLVASLPDGLLLETARLFTNASVSPAEYLRRLDTDWGMTVVRTEGWLVLEPERPSTARATRVDRPALGRLLRALATQGRWTLNDKATYAAQRPIGLGDPAFDTSLCQVVNPDGMERGLFNPFLGQTEALRFWGLLSHAQRQTLLSGRPLPLSAFSGASWEALHRMVYFSADGPEVERGSRRDRGRGMMGFGDPREERTFVLPNGVPRNGSLSVRLERQPVAIGVTQDGRYGSAQTPREIALARSMQAISGGDARWFQGLPTYERFQLGERSTIRLQFALAQGVSLRRSLSEATVTPNARPGAFDALPEAFRRQVQQESERIQRGVGARGQPERSTAPPRAP